MFMSFNRVVACAVLLSCISLSAHAYHNTLLKARVGYLDLKESINAGSNNTAANQKITDGAIVEIAFAKLFTSNIGVEFGTGYSFIKTKRNTVTSKKDSNIIPIYGTFQFHLPIRNTFVPYVGIGYSYNIIQNTSAAFKIKTGHGLIYQAGLDLFISNSWGINLDFKYSKIKHTLTDNGENFKARFKNFSSMIGVTLPL